MTEFLLAFVNRVALLTFSLTPAIAWQLMTKRGQTRAGSFFGVRVKPDFGESPIGRVIFREFRFRLWLSALSVAAVVQVLPFRAGIAAGPLLTWLLGWILFSAAHRRTLREGPVLPAPALRAASIANDESGGLRLDVLDWLAMLLPPAIPAAATVLLLIHGRGAPRGLSGIVRFNVFYAMVLGLMCAANQWALRFRARSSDWAPTRAASRKFRTYLGVMFASIFMFPISQICLFAVADGHPDMPMYFAVSFPVEALWLVFVWRLRFWLVKHLATESSDPMSDACWKWGFFYFNPADPALVVPLRTGVGQSFNCGRPGVLAFLVLVMAVTLVSLALTAYGPLHR